MSVVRVMGVMRGLFSNKNISRDEFSISSVMGLMTVVSVIMGYD